MKAYCFTTVSAALAINFFANGCITDHELQEVEHVEESASPLCTDSRIADVTFDLPHELSCDGLPPSIDCDIGTVFLTTPDTTYADDRRCTVNTSNGAFVVDIGDTHGRYIGGSIYTRQDVEQSACESGKISAKVYGLGNYGWTRLETISEKPIWLYIDSWFCHSHTGFYVDASEYYMIRIAAEASWISDTITMTLPPVTFPPRGTSSRREITVPVHSPLLVGLSIWESSPPTGEPGLPLD